MKIREAQAKARVLTEALPYMRKWGGATVVIKAGGEVLDDRAHLESLATDVVLMRLVGINPIVVHGGGRQISDAMRRRGRSPSFVAGQRRTDAETMAIVKEVLGEVNRGMVAAMNRHGRQAVGISGEDGNLLVARPLVAGHADLDFTGEVEAVNPGILEVAIEREFIPVVAPIGLGPGGCYNINADLAAAAVAAALRARKIVFMTNVPGLYRDLGDAGSLVSEITVDQLGKLLTEESLSDGMIPKITGVLEAMRAGVPQAHLLDGRMKHALLLEIFTDEGVGTMVLP
ncbi:MAG: acetylglutamate kinase [Actinomycetota bacterium]